MVFLLERAQQLRSLGFDRSRGVNVSGYAGQGLRDIFELAPNLHKYDRIATGTAFTSASLATQIAGNKEIPKVIVSFLGRNPISVHVSSSSSGEAEIALHSLNQSSIDATIYPSGKVKALGYRIGSEPVKPMRPVGRQQLVHDLLDCISADLGAVREEFKIHTSYTDPEIVRATEISFEARLMRGKYSSKPGELDGQGVVIDDREPALSS